MKYINIRGARTHNLKNVDVNLPRDQLIVITGLSGSGKSSLAFDTLFAEGQRRYVESLSTYARQFLSMMEKPDVDHIDGLSPAIAIEQKTVSHNPRSTVGTVTEIYDYLRLLFARIGEPRCPEHNITLHASTVTQMVDEVLTLSNETKIMILAPVVTNRKGKYQDLFETLRAQGFVRVRVDGELYELDSPPKLTLRQKHTIEVVIDRLKVRDDMRTRIADSCESALKLADGLALLVNLETQQERLFSARFACPKCGYSLAELEPRIFSFNSPQGACQQCDGLGVQQYFDVERVVTKPDLSIAEGAIKGWDASTTYYFPMLEAVAKQYGFSLDKPFNKLTKKHQDVVLYGSGNQAIHFVYINTYGEKVKRTHPFEGVIPNLERRYRETESMMMREELAKYLTQKPCEACQGSRLNKTARNIFIQDHSLPMLTQFSIAKLNAFFDSLHLKGQRLKIAEKVLKEITSRLHFLIHVGLDYLTLARSAETLSGGEAQRIRLASQIGSGLVGVMYILDEPSIGLHQRDNERLLQMLMHLRDLGNTVIVVEHDEDAMRYADYLIDMGPGAGIHGGEVVAHGTPEEIMRHPNSLTGQYLTKKRSITIPEQRRTYDPEKLLRLIDVNCHNLKNVTLEIPLELMTCITGVSGSGKSSLINDTLYPALAKKLEGTVDGLVGDYADLKGVDTIDKVINIDQSPIGRTPRSNPATYTGLFTPIRELFAQTSEARARGYPPGRFSFNVKGGRCEACEGDGLIKVEMHFLPDVYVTCDECQGKRYNRETLEVLYKGKNIYDVLHMTVEEGLDFFKAIPQIARKLQTLMDVGLGYAQLGQSATTLSGGEAQRVKLARELAKRSTGSTIYILDEPTTGLHFYDIEHLLNVLHRLRNEGNTIIVIEHNLDVIKTADWIVDLGPEGGERGGEIITKGTPEQIAKCKHSYTGQFLRKVLNITTEKVKAKSQVC